MEEPTYEKVLEIYSKLSSEPRDYYQLCEIFEGTSDEEITILFRALHVLGPREHFSLDHGKHKIMLTLVVSEGSKVPIPISIKRFGIKSFVPVDPDEIPRGLKPRGVIEIAES